MQLVLAVYGPKFGKFWGNRVAPLKNYFLRLSIARFVPRIFAHLRLSCDIVVMTPEISSLGPRVLAKGTPKFRTCISKSDLFPNIFG